MQRLTLVVDISFWGHSMHLSQHICQLEHLLKVFNVHTYWCSQGEFSFYLVSVSMDHIFLPCPSMVRYYFATGALKKSVLILSKIFENVKMCVLGT